MTDLLRRPVNWMLAAALMLALQLGAIGWIIHDRASILRSPTVITLRPEPVDPRDLFRGDYVILTYRINTLAGAPGAEAAPRGEDVWVAIGQAADGAWRVGEISRERMAPSASRPVVLRAKIGGSRLTYGIERFYVPEGEGRALEEALRRPADDEERVDIEVDVAVDADGRAAVKALRRDGVLLFEEPLY